MAESLTPRERLIALAALVGGGAAMGTAPIFVRLAVDAGVGPSATAFWRLAFALAPLMIWSLAARPSAPPLGNAFSDLRGRALMFACVAGVFFAGDIVTWHAGIVRTTAANATLFANLTPVVVALAAWLVFKERPSGVFVAALAATLFGAGLLSGAGLSAVAPAEASTRALGDLLSVTTALWYAGYMLAVKAARTSWSTPRVLLISTIVSAPIALAAGLAFGEAFVPTRASGWIWLVALGFFSHIAGQGGLAYALGRLPAALSALVILVQPVVAALLAWVLFGEALGPPELAGGALIVAGIMLAQREGRRREPPAGSSAEREGPQSP
jgi:drug/metabolite transporter (DMT)-like permease